MNNDEMNVCQNCGIVDSYDFIPDYNDFNENKHKIRRKSVYHRKYHIENILLVIKETKDI